MKSHLARFVKDESGATAIEYGLIAALVSVGIATILGTVGTNLIGVFQDIATKLSSAVSGGGAGG